MSECTPCLMSNLQVADRFKDEKQLDKVMESMFKAGRGKNRLDLNESYDSSIFKTYFL